MSELDKYLESARQGRSVSSGCFTYDVGRALEKLAAHQLENPSLWLVKLFQAAVAGGTPSVQIQLGRRSTTLTFQARQRLTASQLFELFSGGHLPKERWLRNLAIGLRAIYGQKPEKIAWICPDGSRLSLERDGLKTTQEDQREFYRIEITRAARAEYDELCNRCWLAPVAVLLNGKRTLANFPPPLTNPGLTQTNYSFYLAVKVLGNEKAHPALEFELPPPRGIKYFPSIYYKGLPEPHETFLEMRSPQSGLTRTEAVVTLEFQPGKARSALLYVQDGAILEPLPLALEAPDLAFKVYLSGDSLEVDLSGMRAREVNAQETLKSLASPLVRLLDQVENQLHLLRPGAGRTTFGRLLEAFFGTSRDLSERLAPQFDILRSNLS